MQYARVYIDVATGQPIFIHTQDSPIPDGFEPVEFTGVTVQRWDMELGNPEEPHIDASTLFPELLYDAVVGPSFKSAGQHGNLKISNRAKRGGPV